MKLYSLDGNGIEDVVDMRLDFTPRHAVAGEVTALKIKMPEQLPFSCNFANVVGLKTAPECEEVKFNEFRLTRPFNDDAYAGKIAISIVFKNRILPGANLMIKGIIIQSVKTVAEIDYVIDEIIDLDLEFFAPI